jgi:hypothetical protein
MHDPRTPRSWLGLRRLTFRARTDLEGFLRAYEMQLTNAEIVYVDLSDVWSLRHLFNRLIPSPNGSPASPAGGREKSSSIHLSTMSSSPLRWTEDTSSELGSREPTRCEMLIHVR